LPLLLGATGASAIAWLFEDVFEWAFLGTSAVLGFASLVPAYRRGHHRRRCLVLFLLGMVAILAGRLAPEGVSDTTFVVFGAALIFTSHAANLFLCRSCRACRVNDR
jgi:hypothetical protein